MRVAIMGGAVSGREEYPKVALFYSLYHPRFGFWYVLVDSIQQSIRLKHVLQIRFKTLAALNKLEHISKI